MKTEELKEKGLTDEQISFVMAENGKDIGKVQKKLDDMTTERDKEKGRADTAEETLKKFEGVDVDAIKKDLADWKEKATKAESDYNQKIADRDFDDMLKDSISAAKGLNYKAIRALLDVDTLKASKNQKEDVEKAIKDLAAAEDSKMLFSADQKQVARFTQAQTGVKDSTITKKDILEIKDRDTRLNMISQHKELFQ